MDLVIRHVTDEDVEAVHEILTSPHVVSGSMRVPLSPLRQTRSGSRRPAGSTSWSRRPRGGWWGSGS
jgi:hypothetical protein